MSRENYYISVNRTLVEVTEEQYLCYYRSKRRMRYFEQDIKTETPIRDKAGNITGYAPSKEDSLERLCDLGADFVDAQESVEDVTIRALMSDKLYEALDKLPKVERELIDALYFANNGGGMSERDYALITRTHHMTIHSRKVRILQKLKKLLDC